MSLSSKKSEEIAAEQSGLYRIVARATDEHVMIEVGACGEFHLINLTHEQAACFCNDILEGIKRD